MTCSTFGFSHHSGVPSPKTFLQENFGHSQFREGQEEVIEILLKGRSSLAVFPTGGGKSLCYQLPALMLEGLTLVISPLIALMKDQVDALQAKGIPAARLDSTLSTSEVAEIYRKIQDRTLKLLYIAPERLSNETFRNRLADIQISLLAIDEAHCISEWGHNFRPDYLKIAQYAKEFQISRVLALTATATPKVCEDIRAHFEIREEDHIQLTFHRSNLHLKISPTLPQGRNQLLLDRLQSSPTQPTIIYVTLQHTAESVASLLNKNNLLARPYHAGLRPELRAEIQEEFMSGKTPIICATIAFGMGIDKSDIRAIYHYNLPKSLENYTQEIGRAGRDGEDSHCEMLACLDDLRVLENFIYGDTPSPDSLKMLMRHILDQPGEFNLSTYDLSVSYDIRPLVINTLLTYLEIDGWITSTRKFFTTYQVKFSRSLEHLLKGFNTERQHFLTRLFNTAKSGKIWQTINPAEAAETLGEDEEKIRKALTYLEELGDVILKPSGVRQGYRLLKKADDFTSLTARMVDLFERRENSDIDRLNEVTSYAVSGSCHTQYLLHYFGETSEPCQHCDQCLNSHSVNLPASEAPEISHEELDEIQSLIDEKHAALRSPHQLARFLCGLTSPATSRLWYLPQGARRKKRLLQHDAYALLENHRYQDVLTLCDSQIL